MTACEPLILVGKRPCVPWPEAQKKNCWKACITDSGRGHHASTYLTRGHLQLRPETNVARNEENVTHGSRKDHAHGVKRKASYTMDHKKVKKKERAGHCRKNAHAVHHHAGSHSQPRDISKQEKVFMERQASSASFKFESVSVTKGRHVIIGILLFPHPARNCSAESKFIHQEESDEPPSPRGLRGRGRFYGSGSALFEGERHLSAAPFNCDQH